MQSRAARVTVAYNYNDGCRFYFVVSTPASCAYILILSSQLIDVVHCTFSPACIHSLQLLIIVRLLRPMLGAPGSCLSHELDSPDLELSLFLLVPQNRWRL